MAEYLTFDEAATLLSVSNSTLYRWLREKKVPGHKAGRQWRFVRSELEAFLVDGGSERQAALQSLADYLQENNEERSTMDTTIAKSPSKLAESVLWDAVDSGARVVHLQPSGTGHSLRYRTDGGLEEVVELGEGALQPLDEQWRKRSTAVRNDDHRHLVLERRTGDEREERVQVRYQRLQTLVGTRLTMRLLREENTSLTIDDIAGGDDAARLRQICEESQGLVLLSGRGGSGKTTTAYICLSELAKDGDRVIFTIEEMSGYYLPGVNQIEIAMGDAGAYHNAFSAILESDLDALFITSPFSHHHRSLLWNAALRTAEGGNLVFLQMEAESAGDAAKKFNDTVDRPADDYLLASCWQELDTDDDGKRFADVQVIGQPVHRT